MDINDYHCTTAHAHPRLLRESAKQQGVKLQPRVKLLPCVGCSAAKGFSAPVKKTTHKWSDQIHGRVFVDSTGKKDVVSNGGKQYGIIFRDDATRMSREYFCSQYGGSIDISTVVTVGMTAVLQVERFNLIGQFEYRDCHCRSRIE